MGRTVALSTLRQDVRDRADINSATVRHSATQIDRFINQSIQMFRERISDEGSTHYLVSSSGTLGTGPTSPYAFYQLDLSGIADLVRVYSIDVTLSGGQVVTLDRVPFENRNDYGTAQSGGIPVAWAPFRTAQAAILPASSEALPYTVWYLPKFTDLSADGDTFDGVAGWEEWVIWDVVAQIAIRDQNPQGLQVAEARRVEVEQRVIRGATKVTQAGGAHVGRDSFGGKLTHFLGGRRQSPAVAGGPYVPADGSVTNQMLAGMTGPTVKGVMSGTTRPKDVQVATLTTYLGLFNTLQRGVVPPPLSTTGLFLRDDGTWASAAGAGSAQGASGAVQYQAGGGAFGGASGFSIVGHSPSLIARIDGTIRLTGGQVEVGSGTVKVSPSGVDVGGGSVVGVGTLVASAIAAPAFTDTTAGLAPLSGGGTSNFLRADGTWTAPPGGAGGSPAGASGAIQYAGVGAVSASPDWSFQASGTRLHFGRATGIGVAATPTGFLVFNSAIDMSLEGTFQIGARSQKNQTDILYRWTPSGVGASTGGVITYGQGSGTLQVQRFHVAPSGIHRFEVGASGASDLELSQTGLSNTNHFRTRSLSVASGIPNDQLSPMASGTVKAQLGADGIPQDVPLHSLTAALYHFDTVTRGVVPVSPGGTNAFLRADGSWSNPPGGSATPSGAAFSVQFQNNGAFGGATGVAISGSGQSVRFGTNPAATGEIGLPHGGAIYGKSVAGASTRVLQWDGSDERIHLGASGVKDTIFRAGTDNGDGFAWQSANGLTTYATLQRSGGVTDFDVEGSIGAGDAFFESLGLSSGIDNAYLAPMASGTVKGQLGPTGAPVDIPIATLAAFAPTFTAARMGVVPASGGGTTNYLRADGTWTAPSGAAQYPPVGGVTNLQMAVMSTGTVKANLAGNATPSDVPLATLLAFAPTFTAQRMGVVPASGGGTSNFLRADGVWDIPPGSAGSPGGAIGNIQFNTGASSFGGATGLNIVASGQALAFGVPSFLPGAGDIRVASGFNITANLPSGIGGVAARQTLFDWSGGGASGVLKVGGASGILGTNRNEVATGGAHEWLIGGQTGASLRATGADFSQFHIRAKSLDVFHINGLPTDANQLKRGIDIGRPGGTGIPSGLNLYVPGTVASGSNRYIIPSGFSTAVNNIILNPTGGRGGMTIRVERLDPAGTLNFVTPTGTILYAMPSGRKHVADFVFTKPSGFAFEHGGSGDLF